MYLKLFIRNILAYQYIQLYLYLTIFICTLIIILTAYSTAKFFFPSFKSDSPASIVQNSYRSEIDFNQLSTLHLFGKMSPTLNNLPLANLNLTLTGIFFSPNPAQSIALLTDAQGRTHTYHLNQMISAKVKIIRIFSDALIVQTPHQNEKLLLPNRPFLLTHTPTGIF